MTVRPPFVDRMVHAYNKKRKTVILLTGDTRDLFFAPKAQRYLPLEQTLYQEFREKRLMMRLDASRGLSFYDDGDKRALVQMLRDADALVAREEDRIGSLEPHLTKALHEPLRALVLLTTIYEAVNRYQSSLVTVPGKKESKSLCVIVQYAASLFPAGDFERLSELDRQRLVTFLNMIEDPAFVDGSSLVVLVSDTRAEINPKIVGVPHSEVIEIGLPVRDERQRYVDFFCATNDGVKFADGANFVDDAAGLTLRGVEDLLEVSLRTGEPITRKHVVAEVNARVKSEMDGVVEIVRPEHTTADIIGYEATNAVLRKILANAEDPETAASAIVVSGPNGGGKTFQMEGHANVCGRVVIRIAKIRSRDFGGTEVLIERLRMLIETYGKLMIMMDEAHTQFGSVHDSDVHETEKRLAGSYLNMMADPRFAGKVIWVLMTSRPDELDPDVKSRASEQIPIFDLEGEERTTYVKELFARKKILLTESELEELVKVTAHFSNRDFKDLLKKVKGERKDQPDITPMQVLQEWKATTAIVAQRRMQTLIAFEHCSYPRLIPKSLASMDENERAKELKNLRFLHRM